MPRHGLFFFPLSQSGCAPYTHRKPSIRRFLFAETTNTLRNTPSLPRQLLREAGPDVIETMHNVHAFHISCCNTYPLELVTRSFLATLYGSEYRHSDIC